MRAMCFNGAKSWQLGWYADNGGHKEVDLLASGDSIGTHLAALDDYLQGKTVATGQQEPVVMKINNPDPDSLDDYYVMYNKQKGVNFEVREYPDEVVIVKGSWGKQSWIAGHLHMNGNTMYTDFDYGGAAYPYKVLNVRLNDLVLYYDENGATTTGMEYPFNTVPEYAVLDSTLR